MFAFARSERRTRRSEVGSGGLGHGFAVALLAALLGPGAPLPAAMSEAAQETPVGPVAPVGRGVGDLGEVVDVAVVTVDVVATDRDGRPARDLTHRV